MDLESTRTLQETLTADFTFKLRLNFHRLLCRSFHVLAVSDNSPKEKLICLVCFVFVVIVVFQQIVNRYRVARNSCGFKFLGFFKGDAYRSIVSKYVFLLHVLNIK